MTETLEQFLETFKITPEDFHGTGLTWEELQEIKRDYRRFRKELDLIAHYIEEKLQELESVHSVRYRIKNPDHLLAKIIRKRIFAPERIISIENYRSCITDLIGIRAIHLFKEDWVHIHEFITRTWDLFETPIAYIRASDNGPYINEYKQYGFDIKEHRYGYRSVHYLIESKPSKDRYIAEIQVRTIFEEGWSEIDHTIKYPKVIGEPLLDTFLDNFNVLAGNSDKMGSFVRNLKEDLLRGTAQLEMYEKLTEKHMGIIDTLTKRVAGTRGELNAQLKNVKHKIQALTDTGVDTKPFTRTLRAAQNVANDFEHILAEDPQQAAEQFEQCINELKRLEILLDIVLGSNRYDDSADGDTIISTYRECAVQFTHNIQAIAKLETSITKGVTRITNTETSFEKIGQAIQDVSNRKRFTQFILGPNYYALTQLSREIFLNKKKIQMLEDHAAELTDPAAKFVLWTQIDLFMAQNKRLEQFVKKQQGGVSLFGWLVRLFAR